MSRLALCSGRDLLQHDRFHQPNYPSLAVRQTIIGWILAVIVALGPWALPAAHAQSPGVQLDQSLATTAGAFVPGHVLVGWNALASKENAVAAVRRQGWTVLRTLDPLPVALVEVPVGTEMEAIALLEADPAVAYAETDALAFATSAPASPLRLQPQAPSSPPAVSAAGYQPNDPGWAQQWAPRRIKAHEAWDLTTGSAQVVVAVVDSGIDLTHPEFAGRLLPGFDYVQWDNQPQDEYGHGTHAAGIIAASGDNGAGVAGLGWHVKILPLRVLDRDGSGTASNVASAISNAANQHADVINLSLALSGPNETVLNAILFARGNGVALVAAAGNDTLPGQAPAPVRYPARYAEVIAVAASTHWEDWATYSNGGPEVDFAAPGGEFSDQILSTGLNGGTALLYGTSMAAAYVSGVVALLRSQTPDLTQSEIEQTLRATADKIGSYPYSGGRNDRLGYGRVQAAAAVRLSTPPTLVVTPGAPSFLVAQGQVGPSTEVQLTNVSGQPLLWQVVSTDPSWLRANPTGGGGLAYPEAVRLRVSLSPTPPVGLYYATVVIRSTDPGGEQSDTIISVRVVVAGQLRRTFIPAVGTRILTPGWQEIVGGGIGLSLGDDGSQPVALPFTFPFYGRWHGQVWVNANGFLSFERGYSGGDYATNACVPTLTSPNGAIYALWDDLNPGQGGRVAFGNTADGGFAVEWRDVPGKVNAVANTFQVILRSSGEITINYRQVGAPNSATVGLESWDASLSWQDACNGAGIPPVSPGTRVFQAALPSQ
jgi:subtilisin family serine protease